MHAHEQASNEWEMRPAFPRAESSCYCCMCTENKTQNQAYSSCDYCADTKLVTDWTKSPVHRETQLLCKHKVSHMRPHAECIRYCYVYVLYDVKTLSQQGYF
jgi:hypothetical protein